MLLIAFTLLFLIENAANGVSVKVTSGTIIGGGRIGLHLHESNGLKDHLLKCRSDSIPDGTGPIYVCTRNNDLDDIIKKTPLQRREDLVFLQNGVLTSFLRERGLESNTQALIYYAVAKKGEAPIDGKTDLNPEGLTAVTGKWANDFASRMAQAGLSCNIYDKPTWTVAMLEKHIWICAFMAVGAKYQCTVGEVEKLYNAEVRTVITELANAVAKEVGLSFSSGVEDRLCAYARSVAHFPTALKEFEWRNGWFTDITFKAEEQGQRDPCPLHTALIRYKDDELYASAKKAWIAKKAK